MYGLMGEPNPDPMRMTGYISKETDQKECLNSAVYILLSALPSSNCDNAITVHCAHQRALHFVFIFKSGYPDFELPIFSV